MNKHDLLSKRSRNFPAHCWQGRTRRPVPWLPWL